MSDLISRADAIEAVRLESAKRGSLGRGDILNILSALPSADAVEVVRCKECRHRDLFSCPLADNDFQKDDDYCSWGERREE